MPDKPFKDDVIAMQKRLGHTLGKNSQASLAICKWTTNTVVTSNERNDEKIPLADKLKLINESKAKQNTEHINDEQYSSEDCLDHVIGSTSEVEWLWSEARYILTSSCS